MTCLRGIGLSLALAACVLALAGKNASAQNGLATYLGSVNDDDGNKIGTVVITLKGGEVQGYRALGNGRRVTLSAFEFKDVKYDVDQTVALLGVVQQFNSLDGKPLPWNPSFIIYPQQDPSRGAVVLPAPVGAGKIDSLAEDVVKGQIVLDKARGGARIDFTARRKEVNLNK